MRLRLATIGVGGGPAWFVEKPTTRAVAETTDHTGRLARTTIEQDHLLGRRCQGRRGDVACASGDTRVRFLAAPLPSRTTSTRFAASKDRACRAPRHGSRSLPPRRSRTPEKASTATIPRSPPIQMPADRETASAVPTVAELVSWSTSQRRVMEIGQRRLNGLGRGHGMCLPFGDCRAMRSAAVVGPVS